MNGEYELETGLARLVDRGIGLPPAAGGQINAYLTLLAKWNRTYNLTAIREPARMVTHHALDALAILPHLPEGSGLRVLDLGTGAGVPGVLLAIARPEWLLTLIDSNHKKGAFLQQVAAELRLRNVEIVIQRIEDYGPLILKDIVISRAFADLKSFASAGLPLLAGNGKLLAMKGLVPHEELAQLPSTIRVLGTYAVNVPGLDAERHVVVMERA